jgi:hypothetical protein
MWKQMVPGLGLALAVSTGAFGDEIPLIMKETVPLGVAWGQEVGPKAAERAMERLKKKGVEL